MDVTYGVPLVEFVRDNKGNPVGAVVALSKDQIGWSKLHPIDRKRWNKERAVYIAHQRARKGSRVQVPGVVRPYLEKMEDRAQRYFAKNK